MSTRFQFNTISIFLIFVNRNQWIHDDIQGGCPKFLVVGLAHLSGTRILQQHFRRIDAYLEPGYFDSNMRPMAEFSERQPELPEQAQNDVRRI